MFAVLNSLNNQRENPEIRGVSKPRSVKIRKGKLLDRIEEAKTKKEKRELINEWLLDEIKKINKNSECDDF